MNSKYLKKPLVAFVTAGMILAPVTAKAESYVQVIDPTATTNDVFEGVIASQTSEKQYEMTMPEKGYFSLQIVFKEPVYYSVKITKKGAEGSSFNKSIYKKPQDFPIIGVNKGDVYDITISTISEETNGVDFSIKPRFTASNDWETEENDKIENANEMNLDQKMHGTLDDQDDVDWFKVKADTYGNHKLIVEPGKLSDGEGYNIEVYNSDKKMLWKNYNVYEKNSSFELTGKGYYFIKVDAHDNTRVRTINDQNYTLTMTSPTENDWEQEPNDSFETAQPFDSDQLVKGNLTCVNDEEDIDYFKFNISGTSTLEFNIGEGIDKYAVKNGWKISLYDEHHGLIQENDVREYSLIDYSVNRGTYYLEISPISNVASENFRYEEELSGCRYLPKPYQIKISDTDKIHGESVKGFIENLPKAEQVTKVDEKDISDVRNQYDQLSAKGKQQVPNDVYQKLFNDEYQIDVLTIGEESAKKVSTVKQEIESLPETNVTQITDQDQITKIRNDYDLLSSEEQNRINTSYRDKLFQDGYKMEALKISAQIDKLPSTDAMTLSDEDIIKAIQASIDQSNEDTQNYISQNAVDKLKNAKDQIEKIKKQEEDKSDGVVDQIDALPYEGDVTLDDEEKITAAKNAYDALSDYAKSQVGDIYVKILNEDVARINYYHSPEYQYDQAKEKVDNLIDNLDYDSSIDLNDEAAVNEAQTAYNTLPADYQAKVSDDRKQKLNEDIAKINSLKAAAQAATVTPVVPAQPTAPVQTTPSVVPSTPTPKATVSKSKKAKTSKKKKTVKKIKIGKTTLKSVKAGKKSITVKWKKAKNAKQYIVAYVVKGSRKWKLKKTSKLSYKIKGLKSHKKYMIMVWATRGTIYGSNSKIKTVKVK